MAWQAILALVLAVPLMFFPAAFVLYLNVSGAVVAIKEARRKGIAAIEPR